MEDLEYITAGALMLCDQGGAPDFFKPDYNQTVKIKGCLVATNKDAKPLINIPSFKVCKMSGGPCTPATVPNTWQDTWPVKVKGEFSLIGQSTCSCTVGGKIEFMTSGQVPLPDDAAQEVKDLQEQAQRELDDSGQGDSVGEAGLVEGMIPVWGSGRDLVNDIQTGDVGGAVLNGAFLVWDVVSIGVGIFTFGAGTAAMQGAKAGVKGAIKAGAKMVSKEALQGLGKAGLKKLSKDALKKSIDDVAKKLLRTCVFACFPAGTLIDTEFGKRKIEDIKIGERVWAYDEETGETGLQEVIDLMQRESDHSIEIHLADEVITTTALHPFFVNGAWVDASELKPGDRLVTKELVEAEIIKTEFKYEPIKVFNFEVAHWHTYFVGVLAWLVHNAGKCISQFVKKVSDDTYDLILKYKKGWSEAQRKAAREKAEALTKANTKVVKNPARKSGTKKTFEKAGGKVKKGEDVDHIQDLQLDGVDDATNMKGLDNSVNRSLGSQIQKRIGGLSEGTKIRNVTIID